MGTSYIPLRAMLPKDRKLDFVIVENQAVCERGTNLFESNPDLSFRTDLPSPPETYDIVHFGSSLHYVDDWQGLLEQCARLRPEYVLFADLPAAENVGFVTLQYFHGRRIPVRFWNLDAFTMQVERIGFDLLLRSRYLGRHIPSGGELPTWNFPNEHRLTHTSQLVFRRANPDFAKRS